MARSSQSAAGAIVSLLLLFGSLLPAGRPALGRSTAGPGPGNTVATATPRLEGTGTAPYPSPPAQTRTPTPAWPTPVYVNGPSHLVLWDSEAVVVLPAVLEAENGPSRWSMPDDGAGWHPDTADCGQGVTVIGGHVAYDGLPGVFRDLPSIGAGERVVCVDKYGQGHQFAPVDYLVGDTSDPPATWYPGWAPALLLYTCTPELNGQIIIVRFAEEEGDCER